MPSASEIESSGFALEDYEPDPVEVWPENWQAWELFEYMFTQWRYSFIGRAGLDYVVLHHKMDRMKLDPDRYELLENDVRVMEQAALEEMRREL